MNTEAMNRTTVKINEVKKISLLEEKPIEKNYIQVNTKDGK